MFLDIMVVTVYVKQFACDYGPMSNDRGITWSNSVFPLHPCLARSGPVFATCGSARPCGTQTSTGSGHGPRRTSSKNQGLPKNVLVQAVLSTKLFCHMPTFSCGNHGFQLRKRKHWFTKDARMTWNCVLRTWPSWWFCSPLFCALHRRDQGNHITWKGPLLPVNEYR